MKLTTEWYQRKFREIQSRLPDAGLDALLLLDPFNIFYATGFFHQPTERPLAVLVPGAGEPIFFVPLLEEDMARRDLGGRTCAPTSTIPAKSTRSIWMLSQIKAERLGFDNLSIRDWWLAQSARPGARISDLVYTMRLVKDPEEIALLDKAGIYADLMVEKAREAIILGLSEMDAFDYAREKTVAQMQVDLGELVFVNAGLVNGAVLYGDHSAFPHGLMTDRKPQPGHIIEVGIGAKVSTYESESEHTFIYGKPTDRGARLLRRHVRGVGRGHGGRQTGCPLLRRERGRAQRHPQSGFREIPAPPDGARQGPGGARGALGGRG